MDSIGAEVGQKMRSAIKAKLMELDCYVDDELPDYIMVMVANKRTKSQMNEDLQLFLNNKTSTFVDWLHIVLKKLKEVTVTNPDIYNKRTTEKRKSSSEIISDFKIKKEKREKKKNEANNGTDSQEKSLTDDLPITANRLAEQRKIVIMKENKASLINKVNDDGFDIPLLHEVQGSSEQELEEIEKKIRNVKSRLGLLVDSEEEDEDCIKIKAEHDDLFFAKDKDDSDKSQQRTISIEDENSTEMPTNTSPSITQEKRPEHRRITFSPEESIKKSSVRDRLGKRSAPEESNDEPSRRKTRISLSEFRKDEERYSSRSRRSSDDSNRSRKKETKQRESILSRLGVMSKVSIPQKEPEQPEEEFKGREVASVVKIKPRVIPSDVPQPNKNLLLKAMAEAQRSVAQTRLVGSTAKPDALYTKKYKEKQKDNPKTSNRTLSKSSRKTSSRRLSESEKNKLKNLLFQTTKETNDNNTFNEDEDGEYIPKPVTKKIQDDPKYVPSSKSSENGEVRQQFIITLDGIDKNKYKDLEKMLDDQTEQTKTPVKARLEGRRTPSPITFDKEKDASPVKSASLNIPRSLPIVHPPNSLKNKERCKYWPNCRQGDKCEFVHPVKNCEMFPHCKFGDKCLYIHPVCKFGTACTKRDCCYSHNFAQKAARGAAIAVPIKNPVLQQTCKYFPNCTNLNCAFYHPKPCKFGKFCKNQSECTFLHTNFSSSLTWRPKTN